MYKPSTRFKVRGLYGTYSEEIFFGLHVCCCKFGLSIMINQAIGLERWYFFPSVPPPCHLRNGNNGWLSTRDTAGPAIAGEIGRTGNSSFRLPRILYNRTYCGLFPAGTTEEWKSLQKIDVMLLDGCRWKSFCCCAMGEQFSSSRPQNVADYFVASGGYGWMIGT